MRFINATEIAVGDTIAWPTSHPLDILNYMTVDDIEEGEDNFVGYDNGQPIYNGEEYSVIVLKGTVMCVRGVRIVAHSERYNDGYPMNPNVKNILLINRLVEQ